MRDCIARNISGVTYMYHKYEVANLMCNVGKDNGDELATRYREMGFQAVRELNGNIQLIGEDSRFGWIFYFSYLVEFLDSGFYRSIDCETRNIQSI